MQLPTAGSTDCPSATEDSRTEPGWGCLGCLGCVGCLGGLPDQARAVPVA